MGMFFPCVLAAVLNGCAFQIFREPMKMGNGPLLALYLFILATFLLLWNLKLYPRDLRKIGKLQFLIEFLTCEFLMEDLIIDFWFPLEKFVLDSLPAVSQTIDDWVAVGDWSAEVITDVLKSETTGYVASYAMATFFLIATLHASRMIDLRTLTQEGPRCFFNEIIRKMRSFARKILRKLGIGAKKKVKINESKNGYQSADPCGGLSTHPQLNKKVKRGGYCGARSSQAWNKEEMGSALFCPLHNPHLEGTPEGSDLEDFEDLGNISDLCYS